MEYDAKIFMMDHNKKSMQSSTTTFIIEPSVSQEVIR